MRVAVLLALVVCAFADPAEKVKEILGNVPECAEIMASDDKFAVPSCSEEVNSCFKDAYKGSFACLVQEIKKQKEANPDADLSCFKSDETKAVIKDALAKRCSYHKAIQQCMGGEEPEGHDEHTGEPEDYTFGPPAGFEHHGDDETKTCFQNAHWKKGNCTNLARTGCDNFDNCGGDGDGAWSNILKNMRIEAHKAKHAVLEKVSACHAEVTGSRKRREAGEKTPRYFLEKVPECKAILDGDGFGLPTCDEEVNNCFKDAFKGNFKCMKDEIKAHREEHGEEGQECFKSEGIKGGIKDMMKAKCMFHQAITGCMNGEEPGTEFADYTGDPDPDHDHEAHGERPPLKNEGCFQEMKAKKQECAAMAAERCENFNVCTAEEVAADGPAAAWANVLENLKAAKHNAKRATMAKVKECHDALANPDAFWF